MTEIKPVLEPEAAEFAKATDTPPYLFQLPPAEGRKTVDEVQSSEIDKPAIDEEWITVEGGPTGTVKVRIVRPAGAMGTLPVIFFIHGAVRELAVGADAAVVFPEYDLSPEAKYPTAIEQNYAAAQWVFAHGAEKRLDASRFAAAGDSVGGNMTAVLTLMAKERGDVKIAQQVLFYPVTNADFDTPSYHQFAEHYFLAREGMKWFWDQYTENDAQREEIYASPLRASIEQLQGLPPALVITGEADVLRDEGEAYAAKLRAAGVPVTQVRFGGIIHDFVMLHALASTQAAKTAIKLAQYTLRAALH
jgi:acetyl esterase